MTASKTFTSLVLMALIALTVAAPRRSWAQDEPTEAERLRAENSVLRLELRKLRDQFEKLEERMGRAGFELGASDPPPAPSPLEDTRHGLSETKDSIWLNDLRLRPELGAASPEELAAAWVAGLFAAKEAEQTSPEEVSGAMARYHAFLKGRFLVPTKLWNRVRGRASALPAEGQLGLSCRTLQPLLNSGRLLGVKVQRAQAPLPDAQVLGALGIGRLSNFSYYSDGFTYQGWRVEILPNSPLARAGLVTGDLLDSITTSQDSTRVRSQEGLAQRLRSLAGQEVSVDFRRKGGTKSGFVHERRTCKIPAFGESNSPARLVLCRLDTKASTHEVRLEVVNLEGRWLVLNAIVTTMPEVIRSTFDRLGEAMVRELDASKSERKKTGKMVDVAFKLLEKQIPLYEFSHFERGAEFGLVATPRQAGYPRVTFGFIGELDPRKYPYRARIEPLSK